MYLEPSRWKTGGNFFCCRKKKKKKPVCLSILVSLVLSVSCLLYRAGFWRQELIRGPGKMLLTALFLRACSTCFLISPRTTCQG